MHVQICARLPRKFSHTPGLRPGRFDHPWLLPSAQGLRRLRLGGGDGGGNMSMVDGVHLEVHGRIVLRV